MGNALGLEASLRWVGYLERGFDLSSCYQAGDVFVFASRTETQGLVLLEAMSLGVPVVSTAVMGTRDIVASARGALVAEENVCLLYTSVAVVGWFVRLKHCPDEEGIKTPVVITVDVLTEGLKHCPDEEGIKT